MTGLHHKDQKEHARLRGLRAIAKEHSYMPTWGSTFIYSAGMLPKSADVA